MSGFPDSSVGKESAYQCRRCRRCGFDPWIRKIPWRWAWQPTPAFCLENPTDREAWQAIVHGVQRVRHGWSKWAHMCTWTHASFFVLCVSCLLLLSQLCCEVVAINPFFKGESWGLEKLSNLTKGTQVSSDRFKNGALNCSGFRSLDILSISLLFSKLRVTGFSRRYFVL